MITIIECPDCGQKNQVETSKLKLARCGACKESLIDDDVIPADISDDEIAATLELAPEAAKAEEVDTGKWLVKIGDYGQQEQYVKRGFMAKVKKYASKVSFIREAVAMYYCAMDPATPIAAKATAVGALAYWILPIDLIPDFVPVAGFADDATAVFIAYRAISANITSEHRAKSDAFFAE